MIRSSERSFVHACEKMSRTDYTGGPEGLLASKATEMSEACFAQRRPDPMFALRCADPTCPLCVQVLDPTRGFQESIAKVTKMQQSSNSGHLRKETFERQLKE